MRRALVTGTDSPAIRIGIHPNAVSLIGLGFGAMAGVAYAQWRDPWMATLGFVLMIGWHNIWMASHSKEMTSKAKSIGSEVRSGAQELSAIAIAIALTVLREGSEAALFVQGMLASTPNSTGAVLLGALIGLVAGSALGLVTYFGLLRIPLRRFFSVTSGLLLLLSAGLASQMAKFLIQADLIPSLATPLWDTSWLLPVSSRLGNALYILLGYEDKPSGMQVIFYLTTIVFIAAASSWVQRRSHPSSYKLKTA